MRTAKGGKARQNRLIVIVIVMVMVKVKVMVKVGVLTNTYIPMTG